MSKRVEKQSRELYNYYVKENLNNKQPLAINSTKFANFVADNRGYELTMLTSPMDFALRGMILTKETTTPKEALIFISDSNNTCWKRFTVIKEISHLYLDHESNVNFDNALKVAQGVSKQAVFLPDFLPDNGDAEFEAELKKILEESTKEYIEDSATEYVLSHLNSIGAAETGAVVFAIEIMIPIALKEWIKQQLENQLTLDEIADQLKVPKIMLEYRLNQWFIPF